MSIVKVAMRRQPEIRGSRESRRENRAESPEPRCKNDQSSSPFSELSFFILVVRVEVSLWSFNLEVPIPQNNIPYPDKYEKIGYILF